MRFLAVAITATICSGVLSVVDLAHQHQMQRWRHIANESVQLTTSAQDLADDCLTMLERKRP